MMNLNRNQKLSLFVFGCPDKTKTVRDLMFAGTMAGDTPLRRHLWELAYRIREESAGAEDFDEIFSTVREELEPMLYAPITTYDEENGCYATIYPLLDMLTHYIFASYMDDYDQERLNIIVRHVADLQIKARLDELLNDWQDTREGDTPMLDRMYEGHKMLQRGINWLFGEEDVDEAE